MLSLTEVRRAVRILHETRVGARLDKLVQCDPAELVLHLSGGVDREPGDRIRVLLSARPGSARVSVLPKARPALPQPLAIAQYLKAHLDGARLRAVEMLGEERQLRFRFETRTEKLSVLVSILGPRSNLYVLDATDHVVAAARPIADTRRDLAMNGPWVNPEGKPPSEGTDRFTDHADEEFLVAIEAHYASSEAEGDEAKLAARLRKALKKQVANQEKKVRLLESDLSAADDAPAWERKGELLKSRIRDVRTGMTEIEIPDFETGEPVTIALEPKLTPQKNLDLLFSKARKGMKRARKAGGEVDAARERLAASTALRARLEDASPETLAEIAAMPEIARLLERYFPAPKGSASTPKKKVWKLGKRELPTRLVPKRYRTEAGLEVWVGKNDEGNDILTTRLARGNDLFFHLEGDPGSHVILRTDGAEPPDEESLLDAAELSVNFSKAKKATRASVHIASIKDVSKPKGAKPGLVYVHRGRTIQLRRTSERLERILGSRIDD